MRFVIGLTIALLLGEPSLAQEKFVFVADDGSLINITKDGAKLSGTVRWAEQDVEFVISGNNRNKRQFDLAFTGGGIKFGGLYTRRRDVLRSGSGYEEIAVYETPSLVVPPGLRIFSSIVSAESDVLKRYEKATLAQIEALPQVETLIAAQEALRAAHEKVTGERDATRNFLIERIGRTSDTIAFAVSQATLNELVALNVTRFGGAAWHAKLPDRLPAREFQTVTKETALVAFDRSAMNVIGALAADAGMSLRIGPTAGDKPFRAPKVWLIRPPETFVGFDFGDREKVFATINQDIVASAGNGCEIEPLSEGAALGMSCLVHARSIGRNEDWWFRTNVAFQKINEVGNRDLVQVVPVSYGRPGKADQPAPVSDFKLNASSFDRCTEVADWYGELLARILAARFNGVLQ